jgi:hypothetical protein
MPYITPQERENTDDGLQQMGIKFCPANAGELNFIISTFMNNYLHAKGMRYQYMNDMKGALQGALAEFDRIVVGPYEDKKILENGGVYHNLKPSGQY